MLADQLQALVAELGRPQVQVAQRGQLDQVLGAGARHVRERQAQALQVAERARHEQLGEVFVRGARGQRELARAAFLLQLFQLHLTLADFCILFEPELGALQSAHDLKLVISIFHTLQVEHGTQGLDRAGHLFGRQDHELRQHLVDAEEETFLFAAATNQGLELKRKQTHT